MQARCTILYNLEHMNIKSESDLISIGEAARILGVHKATLRRWDKAGKLKAIRIGGIAGSEDRKFSRKEIEQLKDGAKTINSSAKQRIVVKKYLLPRITIYDSLSEVESEHSKYGELVFSNYLGSKKNIRDISELANDKLFLVAEPGMGKTRLLTELYKKHKNNAVLSPFIDLKQFSESGIVALEDYIKDQYPELKDKKFGKQKSETCVFCLDGLDEIKQSKFSKAVGSIKKFTDNYPLLSVIITSRWHFIREQSKLFEEWDDFGCAVLFPFSNDQVVSYLKLAKIDEQQLNELLTMLHVPDRGSTILQTPRYLELFSDYLHSKKPAKLANLTKADLFNYFFQKRLDIENTRVGGEPFAVEVTLENLALVMETYQTNVINDDDLKNFFDRTDSAYATSLQAKNKIKEILFNRNFLKYDGENIMFDNTEFQEYLAARALKNITDEDKTGPIFDLAIDHELKEIYPSWFPTLTFLVEMNPKLIMPLLSLSKSVSDRKIVQSQNYHKLLTRTNLNKISESEKKEIFSFIWDYYQKSLTWIDIDIAKSLSYYINPLEKKTLEKYIQKKYIHETQGFVQKTNVATLVGCLFERDFFDKKERAYWVNKLIGFANDENENGVLQRHSLYALQKNKDPKIIGKVEKAWNHPRKLVKERFLLFCIENNPDSPITVKYIVEGIKENVFTARTLLLNLRGKTALLSLLDHFKDDKVFAKTFLDRDNNSSFRDYKKLMQAFSDAWDKKMEIGLKNFLKDSFESSYWYHAEDSDFVKEVAILLSNKNENFTNELLEMLSKSEVLKKNIFSFEKLFVYTLKKDDVKNLVKALKKAGMENWLAFRVIQNIKFSKHDGSYEIWKEGKKYLLDEYKEAEKRNSEFNSRPSKEEQIYKQFVDLLEPSKGKFSPAVFEYFVNYEKDVQERWSSKEKERLIELVRGSVFDKFDPTKEKVRATKKTDGSVTHTMHSWISIFGNCVRTANILSIDIKPYRSKIAGYIPFAFNQERDVIYNLLKELKDSEIETIIKVYQGKIGKDLWKYEPTSFIETSEKYKVKAAIPILKKFVKTNTFRIHERVHALKVSDKIKPNAAYLQSVFKKYLNSEPELAEKANELLIVNHKDQDAINWRINQLTLRKFPFNEPKGAHSVGKNEHELHSRPFASPIMNLKSPKYEKQYLNLLKESFTLLKNGKQYFSYVQYLWEIAAAYYSNRKVERSYGPLKNLESQVEKYALSEGSNWFSGKLQELTQEYMLYIGKPRSILESIEKCNNTKKTRGLNVTSAYELLNVVKDIVNTNVRSFLLGQGHIYLSKREPTIQPNLIPSIKSAFYEKGFRPNEVMLYREPQSLDGKRCDFIIHYYHFPPVVLELKLSDHSDINAKDLSKTKSYKSFKRYLADHGADYGILLLLDNEKKSVSSWEKKIEKVKVTYEKLDGVYVLGISSTGN